MIRILRTFLSKFQTKSNVAPTTLEPNSEGLRLWVLDYFYGIKVDKKEHDTYVINSDLRIRMNTGPEHRVKW